MIFYRFAPSSPGEPVLASVPGEFVVCLGADSVPVRLETGMAELLLTWIEWVEVEARGALLTEYAKD